MDELIRDFLTETTEGLQALDTKLVELETRPEDDDLIGNIFRVMHTIKGTCGFLGLNKLSSFAHAGENVMDKIRNKQLKITSDNITIILEAVDAIKEIVVYISEHEVEPKTDYSALISRINAVANEEKPLTSLKPEPSHIHENTTLAPTKEVHNNAQTIKVSVEVLESLDCQHFSGQIITHIFG
jgi:two-component system chemotaxis sensor kinase CheA